VLVVAIIIVIIVVLVKVVYRKIIACILNAWKNRSQYININKKPAVDIGDAEMVSVSKISDTPSSESEEKEDRNRVEKTAKNVPPLSQP
jgi:hypothetical protein